MNLFQEVESVFLDPIEKFGQTVGTDVVTWIKNEATAIVDDAKVAWTVLQPVLTSIGPSQWVILQSLEATAQADVKDGDYADLVTDVLNQAAAKELVWVAGLGTTVLTVVLAALHLQRTSSTPAPAPAPAAAPVAAAA